MDNVLAGISSAVAIIVALVSLYFAIRKHPFDIRKLNTESKVDMVDVAEKYQQIANSAADMNIKLREEIQKIREQLDEVTRRHEQELTDIRSKLAVAEVRAAKFEDWAKRLVAQIESLGETPVPFEPKPRKANA